MLHGLFFTAIFWGALCNASIPLASNSDHLPIWYYDAEESGWAITFWQERFDQRNGQGEVTKPAWHMIPRIIEFQAFLIGFLDDDSIRLSVGGGIDSCCYLLPKYCGKLLRNRVRVTRSEDRSEFYSVWLACFKCQPEEYEKGVNEKAERVCSLIGDLYKEAEGQPISDVFLLAYMDRMYEQAQAIIASSRSRKNGAVIQDQDRTKKHEKI